MFKRFMDDMKKYWKYAVYSSRAQLKSEIANSYLNWLWWNTGPSLLHADLCIYVRLCV